MAHRRHRTATRALLMAVVLMLVACESQAPKLPAPQRLNQNPGSVLGGFMPDYTALSARGSNVATAWIGRSASGRREISMRFSSDGGLSWGTEYRAGADALPDSDAADPQIFRFPDSDDLLVLWEVSIGKMRERAIVAQLSPDQGRTFGPLEVLSKNRKVYDPVALVRGADEIVAGWERQGGGGRQVVVTARQSGRWALRPWLLDPSLSGLSRQLNLAALPDDQVLAVWVERGRRNRGGSSSSHLRTSLGDRGGRAWSPSLPVDPTFEALSPLRPQVIHAAGRSSLVWTTARAGARDRGAVVFSQSPDGASTWSEPQELFVGEEAPFALLQASGEHAYLTWHGGARKDVGVYFLSSPDGGVSWLAGEPVPVRLDDPAVAGNALRPAMEVDSLGRVAVVWTNGFKQVWLRTSDDHGTHWSAPILIAAEQAGGQLKFPHVALGQDRVFVTWERWPDKSLHVKTIGDVGKALPLDFYFRSVEIARKRS